MARRLPSNYLIGDRGYSGILAVGAIMARRLSISYPIGNRGYSWVPPVSGQVNYCLVGELLHVSGAPWGASRLAPLRQRGHTETFSRTENISQRRAHTCRGERREQLSEEGAAFMACCAGAAPEEAATNGKISPATAVATARSEETNAPQASSAWTKTSELWACAELG